MLNPLSSQKKKYSKSDGPAYISHYHLDIVPTLYWNLLWFDSNAYQYTYNHNTFITKLMPSVYFKYQIGGIKIAVGPNKNDNVSYFLIKLCAIVGGIYALATFLDNALDTIIDDRRKQYELISWLHEKINCY